MNEIVDGSLTFKQATKKFIAKLIGKSSRTGAAITYRNQADNADELVLTITETTRTPS